MKIFSKKQKQTEDKFSRFFKLSSGERAKVIKDVVRKANEDQMEVVNRYNQDKKNYKLTL